MYESGAGCHVRNPTPVMLWARGNEGIEQSTFSFVEEKEAEQCGIKTTDNPVVCPSPSDCQK